MFNTLGIAVEFLHNLLIIHFDRTPGKIVYVEWKNIWWMNDLHWMKRYYDEASKLY